MPVNSFRNKKIEKEIKKAADKIPDLIYSQVKQEKDQQIKDDYHKKKLVWIGVIIITALILIMWSWSTFVNFDTLLKKDNPDSILNQAKSSFEKVQKETKDLEPVVIPTTTEKNTKETTEEKIKNNLMKIIDQINTAPTSSPISSSTQLSLPVAKTITNTPR